MPDSDHTGNITVTGWLETLIDLIFRRLELAEDVAADKFASGRPVDDPARERQILDSVARVLRGNGPYQEAVMQFFQDQIAANKAFQRGLHRRWHAHPEEIPAVHPDLAAQIRPELDRITARMLWQLVYMNELPNPGFGHVQALLDSKLAAEPFARKFHGLGRDAAVIALRSFMTVPTRPARHALTGGSGRQTRRPDDAGSGTPCGRKGRRRPAPPVS